MKRASARLGLVLAVSLALAYACAPLAKSPDTAARDAYRAAKVACNVYELAPGSKHTPEADKVCRAMRLVCTDPDEGAGGAGE